MDNKKFESVMILLVPQIIQLITDNFSYDELTAAKEFYSSKVYEILEKEETKLWHLSPPAIFNMFSDEKKKGTFDVPEEV